MARAKKLCSHVGPEGSCAQLQPCPDHAPQPWASSNRRSELPPDWERRRRRILRRDPLCQLAIVCGGASLSVLVHHAGDPLDHRDETLQGACEACHNVTIAQQSAEARRIAAR